MKCYQIRVEGDGKEIDAIVAAHSEESALMILALHAHHHGIELQDERGELDDLFNDPDIYIKSTHFEKMSYDIDKPLVIYAVLR